MVSVAVLCNLRALVLFILLVYCCCFQTIFWWLCFSFSTFRTADYFRSSERWSGRVPLDTRVLRKLVNGSGFEWVPKEWRKAYLAFVNKILTFAVVGCTQVYDVAKALSPVTFPGYNKLTKTEKVEWNNRCVSVLSLRSETRSILKNPCLL